MGLALVSIADAVQAARDAADAIHTDRCDISRPDPDAQVGWTEADGDAAPGTLPVYTDLPCRFRAPSASDHAATAGEHQWSLQDVILQVGATATGIRMGDKVTTTSSPQGVALDGPFTVMSPMPGSHMSSRRFIVRSAN